jgi:hypothetical protein
VNMNNDPEWIRKMAAKESECESVAVGDPLTVECAWCHGTLLRKPQSAPPVSAERVLRIADEIGKRCDKALTQSGDSGPCLVCRQNMSDLRQLSDWLILTTTQQLGGGE